MQKILSKLFLGFSILTVFSILVLTPLNRMAVDDFCYTTPVIEKGIFNAQIYWYTQWSGRHFATFIQTIVGFLNKNNGNTFIYSSTTFIFLLFGIYLFIKKFIKLSFKNTLFFSLIIFASFFYLTPNQSESWFWLAGSATYLWPIILTLFLLPIIFSEKISIKEIFIAAIITFLATSGNETYGLILLLTLIVLFFYFIYKNHSKKQSFLNKKLILMTFIVISSLISFLIMYFSPGNQIRGSLLLKTNIIYSVTQSLEKSPLFIWNIYKNKIFFILITTFVLSMFVSHDSKKNKTIKLDLLMSRIFFSTALFLLYCCLYAIPGFYTLNGFQPYRSEVTLSFFMILFILSLTKPISLIYQKYQHTFIFNILTLFSSIYMLLLVINNLSIIPGNFYLARDYSKTYDSMINQLKKSKNNPGETAIKVKYTSTVNYIYAAQLTKNKNDLGNQCLSNFFKLKNGIEIE